MIALPLLILLGLLILIPVTWFVWHLIKLVIVLIMLAVIFGALWYFGPLNEFIPPLFS